MSDDQGGPGSRRERVADVIKELRRGPRSIAELSSASGASDQTVLDWLRTFEAVGLTTFSGAQWHWGRPGETFQIPQGDQVAHVCTACGAGMICMGCGTPAPGAFFRPRGAG